MGTRSLIHIKHTCIESPTLATIYQQYDGYPDGVGLNIYKILGNSKIINGFSDHESPEYFNGMGCMAAYLISKIKTAIGNVYIYPPDSEECGEEYTYTIYLKDGELWMKVFDVYQNRAIFNNNLYLYGEWIDANRERELIVVKLRKKGA